MKLLKDSNNLKEWRFSIAVIIMAGILGFYLFSNNHNNYNFSENSKSFYNMGSIDVVTVFKSIWSDSENINTENETFEESDVELNDSAEMRDSMDLQELFKDSICNKHTVRVSKAIRMKFSNSLIDLDSHYSQVAVFLISEFDDETKAEEFLSFYKKFTEYEIGQINDPNPLWLESPKNAEEAIVINNEKQEFRRKVFGYDRADKLWGHEMRVSEYKMKEIEILRNENYSAEEKEQLLEDFKEKTWNDRGMEQDLAKDRKSQFYIKLALYSEDLMKMTNEERNEKIREFRDEIFPPREAAMMDFFE